MNDMSRILTNKTVMEVLEKFPKVKSHFLKLQDSKNYKEMVGIDRLVIISINLIKTKSNIFEFEYHDDFVNCVIENVFKVFASDNFREQNITLGHIYNLIDRFVALYDDPNKRVCIGTVKYKSLELFFELICNLKYRFSNDDFNSMCNCLGEEQNILYSIGKFLIEVIKKDDEEVNKQVLDIIEKVFSGNKALIDYFNDSHLAYLYFLLCKYYINKQISLEKLDFIISLLNKNEPGLYNLSTHIREYYYRHFIVILESNNFKKGIVSDSYLDEFFKCYSYEQVRVMNHLLTCEYYEEGFITEEHIKLVSNSKDYIFITCMLDYILTAKFPVEGNKYDVALGILNLDRKKELCNTLYSYLKNADDIEEIKRVALNYLQYNLFFPKFEVKPFTMERVPNSDKK